jgi:hypothetical protein
MKRRLSLRARRLDQRASVSALGIRKLVRRQALGGVHHPSVHNQIVCTKQVGKRAITGTPNRPNWGLVNDSALLGRFAK